MEKYCLAAQGMTKQSIKEKGPVLSNRAFFFYMAESEGFEPPEGLTLRLISSQVHSTELCQLSVKWRAY